MPRGIPQGLLPTWGGAVEQGTWTGSAPACTVVSVSGGRSRLHLIDLGSCEATPSRGTEAAGGPLCLSLSALGSVILALVNGAKHVPYR